MTEKEIKGIIRKHEINAKRKTRKCFLPNCNSNSIASHLLQKNGILNRISHQNHLYQVGMDSFKTGMFYFEKIGINKAFSFPGFCNDHDTNLFKEIEKEEINFNDYRTPLLFSYRILVNEIRKKEILIDWFSSNINDFKLKLFLDQPYFIDLQKGIQGFKQAIKDGDYYLERFYSDINKNTQKFTFLTFELPLIEICASGVFTYETAEEIENIPDWLWDKPLTDIYFNLLPMKNKSIVIFGFLTEMKEKSLNHINSFKETNDKLSLKMIGDLLLTRIENWLCSYSVYQQLKQNENEIVRITHESVNSKNERRKLDFNLFDYIK